MELEYTVDGEWVLFVDRPSKKRPVTVNDETEGEGHVTDGVPDLPQQLSTPTSSNNTILINGIEFPTRRF